MSRLSKIISVASLVLLLASPALAQRFRGGFGGPRVFVGVGPGFYGYGYGPYPYYPGYAYGYYPYGPAANIGDVKIDTKIKNGSIYVDGGYAGVTGKLKKFSLTAGNHDIELRDSAGNSVFKERVDVVPGRTVEIDR